MEKTIESIEDKSEEQLMKALEEAVDTGSATLSIKTDKAGEVVVKHEAVIPNPAAETAYDVIFDPTTRTFSLITVEYLPGTVKTEVIASSIPEMNYKISKIIVEKLLKKGYK